MAESIEFWKIAYEGAEAFRKDAEARLAEAVALLEEGSKFPMLTGERANWLIRARDWLAPERVTVSAPAATCKHGEAGSCFLCDEEDREHDQAMADSAEGGAK